MKLYTRYQAPQSRRAQKANTPLSPEDCQLVVSASLRLLGRRLSHGQPVSESDLLRIAAFAEEHMP
jgi:hypothetical protein